jgi:hypothetical protein
MPASLANVRTAEIRFLVEQQRVIRFPVGKMFATRFARVGAGLNIPLGHEKSLNGLVLSG